MPEGFLAVIKERQPANTHGRLPVRILYVAARPERRRWMLALLKCAGFCCAAASSVPEALNCITTAADAFGLVMVAHQTPRVDGLALERQLRARNFPGRILICSTEFDEADCEEGGMEAVLRKPASSERLL